MKKKKKKNEEVENDLGRKKKKKEWEAKKLRERDLVKQNKKERRKIMEGVKNF